MGFIPWAPIGGSGNASLTQDRQCAGSRSEKSQRQRGATRARVVAPEIAGHVADPGHIVARASRGEHGGGETPAHRGGVEEDRRARADIDNTSECRNGSANILVMETDLAQLAHDRFEIADALHRYAFGLDHGDADSLASAVTEDCRFDFRPAGRKLEIDFPLLIGSRRYSERRSSIHRSARYQSQCEQPPNRDCR